MPIGSFENQDHTFFRIMVQNWLFGWYMVKLMSDNLLGIYFKGGENWHKTSLVKSEFSKSCICSVSTCWSLGLTCVHPFQSE